MRRVDTPELLDNEHIPTADLIKNLQELRFINTYLGGHAVVRAGYKAFHAVGQPLHIMEIGSGGGDNLMALYEQYPANTYSGLDLKKVCVAYAQSQSPAAIQWIHSDFRQHHPLKPYDVIFNSLFCHHFTKNQVVDLLRWMHTNSRVGFFIADLHRHPLAYWSIKGLTQLFSQSYLVRNDAPLSVKRGFTRTDWEELLQQAGITTYQIQWKWAFRHLIIVKK